MTGRPGLGGDLVRDVLDDARAAMRGWQGTQRARVVNVEQVDVLGEGHQVLLTFDSLDSNASFSLVITSEEAAGLAARMYELSEGASQGLFLPT